jgi:hypothetical protein
MANGEGTIISNGSKQMILKGGQWVDYTGPPAGGGRGMQGSNAKLSNQDQMFLNELQKDAQKANETARIYDKAETAVKDLKTGPYRGQFLGAATPEDNGGILDTIGGLVVGAPARLSGAISKKDTDNYQYLRSLQQLNVLEGQTRQRGVQTEGDAARIMLSELSPTKTVNTNLQVIANGRQKAQRAQAKANFYDNWAKTYGLHGLDENGDNASAAWTKRGDEITKQMFGKSNTTIKVISRKRIP